MSERVSVYIDGFNVYYGIRKTGCKWLDLEAISRAYMAPADELVAVKYFTARVRAMPGHEDSPRRQQVYLRALATLPLVEVYFGRFSKQTKFMPTVTPPPDLAHVIKVEEKGSDVALATQMVADAFRGKFTTAMVFSNDSDLCPPIEMVQSLGLRVMVINPHPNTTSPQVAKMADAHHPLLVSHLQACQLPAVMRDRKGLITKPHDW